VALDPEPDVAPPETWTVTTIRRASAGVREITVLAPDGTVRLLLIGDSAVSMQNVRLSVAAAAILWQEKIGATPLAGAD
jgi:hypothetical protein